MVAVDGNTGTYLQYARARHASLRSKAGQEPRRLGLLGHPPEQRLALLLTGFPGAVNKVVETPEPHHPCGCLNELAVALSHFYGGRPGSQGRRCHAKHKACAVLRHEARTQHARQPGT